MNMTGANVMSPQGNRGLSLVSMGGVPGSEVTISAGWPENCHDNASREITNTRRGDQRSVKLQTGTEPHRDRKQVTTPAIAATIQGTREKLHNGIKPMIKVGGLKGGTGKSLMTIVLVALLRTNGEQVILVEADDSNSEAYKLYQNVDGVTCLALDLDRHDGWMALCDIAEENRHSYIVVNTGARMKDEVKQSITFFTDCLESLNRDLVVFWMMNAQKDSVELLNSYLPYASKLRLYAVRNLFFAVAEKFETYNASKHVRPTVEKTGGTIDFPVLVERLVHRLYTDRVPPHEICTSGKMSDRIEMQRWLARVQGPILEAVHG